MAPVATSLSRHEPPLFLPSIICPMHAWTTHFCTLAVLASSWQAGCPQPPEPNQCDWRNFPCRSLLDDIYTLYLCISVLTHKCNEGSLANIFRWSKEERVEERGSMSVARRSVKAALVSLVVQDMDEICLNLFLNPLQSEPSY